LVAVCKKKGEREEEKTSCEKGLLSESSANSGGHEGQKGERKKKESGKEKIEQVGSDAKEER